MASFGNRVRKIVFSIKSTVWGGAIIFFFKNYISFKFAFFFVRYIFSKGRDRIRVNGK